MCTADCSPTGCGRAAAAADSALAEPARLGQLAVAFLLTPRAWGARGRALSSPPSSPELRSVPSSIAAMAPNGSSEPALFALNARLALRSLGRIVRPVHPVMGWDFH